MFPTYIFINKNKFFLKKIKSGCEIAEKGANLVTIGITPDYPETGYGYIKFNPDETDGHAYAVERFVEKPDLKTAKEYLETEEYLWNSGMFLWRVSTILSNIETFLPDLHTGLGTIRASIGTEEQEAVLEKTFAGFSSVSIDYGIMEKAKNIYILPGTFGWDDVGSWLAVGRIKKSNENGNVVDGNVITIDSRDNIIQGEGKLIATIGIEDLIIVDTKDATLICEKNSAADIKKVLENLKICNRDEYI